MQGSTGLTLNTDLTNWILPPEGTGKTDSFSFPYMGTPGHTFWDSYRGNFSSSTVFLFFRSTRRVASNATRLRLVGESAAGTPVALPLLEGVADAAAAAAAAPATCNSNHAALLSASQFPLVPFTCVCSPVSHMVAVVEKMHTIA